MNTDISLTTTLPVLQLPTDFPPQVTRTTSSGRVDFNIPPLSVLESASLHDILLSAFCVLLYRHAGQPDELVIGISEGQAVRFSIAAETAFDQLLAQSQPILDTIAVQVRFAMDNAPLTNTQQYTLTLFIQELNGALSGYFEYSPDLFERTTIASMAQHWQVLLGGISENPQQSITHLPLLTPAERDQILVDWNATAQAYPLINGVHALFAEQVKRTPDILAVTFGTDQLTYAELDRRSNQLAQRLRELGVVPDSLVAVCMSRSIDMVIAVLGILKAGGGYVPLDPAYPAERLAFMLEDARATVLLTQPDHAANLPTGSSSPAHILYPADFIHQRDDCPTNDIQPEHCAYVIYTSGSTGKPKGVVMPHRAVTNLIQWHIANYTPARTAQFASLSFDVSFQEIFSTLCIGGTLVLIAEDTRRDPEQLLHFVNEQQIERLFLPFVALQQLAETAVQGELLPRSLREIITAGEQLQISEAVRQLFQTLEHCRLYNHYGPSESHVVTAYQLPAEPQLWVTLPSIGFPIANTQIYLLDSHMQPIPVGVPGELYIGGVALARGYLNRLELTATKFVVSPFGTLYKTGDLARYLADGRIEFWGRIDQQVKIRGYRVEPGEIEAQLSQHPAIQDAVVVVQSDLSGMKRLVAFVTAEGTLSEESIRQFLKVKLPEYMIPSAIVQLESLPLTPSGKVNRKALSEMVIAPSEDHYDPPTTKTEQRLAAIWEQVLRLPRIGIRNNFFEMGGHSLLAARIVSRIRDGLEVNIPVSMLFEAPTIAQLAQRIDGQDKRPQQPLPRRDPQQRIPASTMQRRLWIFDQLTGSSPVYNITSTIEANGDLSTLEDRLNSIVARHEALRTTFDMEGDQIVQIIAPEIRVVINVDDVRHLSTVEQETIQKEAAAAEAKRSFDLIHGPLIRARMLWLEESRVILIVSVHHIVFDGRSLHVLCRELAGEQPELPMQYGDFALWQSKGQLSNESAQLAYWKEQLSSDLPILALPYDHPRPVIQSTVGRKITFGVDKQLTSKLQQLSRHEGATLFMTLLAAFNVLLYRYTGQGDILVGTAIANRNQIELENLIGFFINTLVLRTRMNRKSTFREVLAEVRKTARDAYAHQEFPFDRLVEIIQPPRDASRSPLFQVSFVLEEPIDDENTSVRLLESEADNGTAKFDLTLTLQEMATGLTSTFEYNTDLFDQETIERMTGHFQTLLAGIIDMPDQPIGLLPLLTAAEQKQILVEWNDTARIYAPIDCIHRLIESGARSRSDKPAVIFDNGTQPVTLTYAELNRRANELAHVLVTHGAQLDSLVGICLDRSPELIVAVLAVLKSGAAYVPLDPTYPAERLAYMLEDSKAALLLTQRHLASSLSHYSGAMLVIDDLPSDLPTDDLKTDVGLDNLAYVIYTSGSTGKPKGVLLHHRGLCNLAYAVDEALDLRSKDVVLQFASLSFDASIYEISSTLLAGATLVVPSKQVLSSPDDLLRVMNMHEVSVATMPPSLLAVLPPDALPYLKTLISAGENCPAEVAARWVSGRRFINAYGPTEITVCATTGDYANSGKPSIGRPIGNMQTYVLDEQLQPVPIGVPGELYIAGVGVARGYHNRPELTAARFIQNPFGAGRLYKSGDRVRWLADGQLDYMERIDQQVKLRGFRIELGEVENTLSQHPAIKACAVIVKDSHGGQKFLSAYIVGAIERDELSSWLRQRLPEYMIPSAFVFLDAMPLTSNKKVDFRALAALEIATDSTITLPQTENERQLALLWQDLFGLDQIDIYTSFFNLGGHSLLAMRLLSRIRDVFKAELNMADFFAAPTIADTARRLTTATTQQVPAIKRVAREHFRKEDD